MSGFDTTLDVLMSSENRDALPLLAQVLRQGDMVLRRRTVERLLETTDGRRQALLVEYFEGLGHELETLVLESIGRLGPALRHAMASRRPAAQLPALRIISQTQDLSLAYLVGEAAGSVDEAVRARAVEMLWQWALEVRRREMSADGPAGVALDAGLARRRKFLLEGLRKAFGLRLAVELPRVLKAAAMLADGSAGWFWGAVELRRDARRQALLKFITERFEPELMGFVVQALEREGVAAEAVELLHRVFDRRDLALLLKEFDNHPQVARAAHGRLREVPWLGAGSPALAQLSAPLVANALALAARCGMPANRLAVLCRTLAAQHPEAEARRMAIDALAHCGEPAVRELRLLADEVAAPLAGGAVIHLVRRGGFERPSREAVANLLRDWWQTDETVRREIAHSMTASLRSEPGLLRAHLSRNSATVTAAVNLARQAGAADVFAEQLKELAGDGRNVRLQSAALRALAESMATGVSEVLRTALDSGDARVRANALEALDRRQAAAAIFLPFTDDANNRVRANAAMALIERSLPEGRETLRRMLKSTEADRVSALWVFSRTRPKDFATTARMLASQDPSSLVRRKAEELLAASA